MSGYAEQYNGISGLTAIMLDDDQTSYEIPFTHHPGAEPGKGRWLAIVPSNYTLKGVTATLAVDGKPAASAGRVTVLLYSPVKMEENILYPLNLTLKPDKSLIRIDPQSQMGWEDSDEGVFETDAIEGIDILLSKEGDKNGSEWTILTARGLSAFCDHVNQRDNSINIKAKLGANIDLEGSPSNRFGVQMVSYGGTFDGAGFSISNFSMNYSPSGDTEPTGLFGHISPTGVVRNLTILNALVISDNYSAGIVAGTNEGHLINCRTSGKVTVNQATVSAQAGGLVGHNKGGTIVGCYAQSDVLVRPMYIADIPLRSGGLVGHNEGGTILACYTTGAAAIESAPNKTACGGLVGYMDQRGTLTAGYYSGGKGLPGVGDNQGTLENVGKIGGQPGLFSWVQATTTLNAAIDAWNAKPENDGKKSWLFKQTETGASPVFDIPAKIN